MTTQIRAFRVLAPTQNVAVLTTTSNVVLNNLSGTRTIRFCNIGNQTVFITFNGVATLAASFPLPAGQTELFTIGNDILSYDVIASATGSTLYSTIGEGI